VFKKSRKAAKPQSRKPANPQSRKPAKPHCCMLHPNILSATKTLKHKSFIAIHTGIAQNGFVAKEANTQLNN
jgi:hypothetical protein